MTDEPANTDQPIKICDHCQNQFRQTAGKYWQRFCSSDCQKQFNRDRRKKAFQALKEKESSTNEKLQTENT